MNKKSNEKNYEIVLNMLKNHDKNGESSGIFFSRESNNFYEIYLFPDEIFVTDLIGYENFMEEVEKLSDDIFTYKEMNNKVGKLQIIYFSKI